MHLHFLSFAGIGPFPAEHVIDLDRLGASGLFLLEGPTGSGKSTILDAITFALYGEVAGAGEGSSNDRIRSNFATPEQPSFVNLRFSTSAGEYRVVRTPSYLRPKRRGSGSTEQKATAKIYRISGDNEALVSDRIQEASAEVIRLIGLDRQQFTQTVVLPQGQFARFLKSKPEDRQKVLQKIFGTQLYDRWTRELAEERRSAERGIGALKKAVDHAEARVLAASGLAGGNLSEAFAALVTADSSDASVTGTSAEADDSSAPPESLSALDALALLLDRLADQVQTNESAQEAAAKLLQQATRDRDEAVASLAAVTERDRLLEEKAQLERTRSEHEAMLARLEAAERAEIAQPALLAAARRSAEASETEKRARAVLAALPGVEWDGAESTVEARLERLRELELRLAPALAAAQEISERTVELAQAQGQTKAYEASLAAQEEKLRERPSRRADLAAEMEKSKAAANGLPAARSELAEARSLQEAIESREKFTAELEATVALVDVAAAAASAAVATETHLREERIRGIAGELAQDLIAGEPCPVCGARSHPSPAVLAPEHVTREAIERAASARREAEAELVELGNRRATLEERLSTARLAAKDATLDESRLAAVEAASTLARLERDSSEHEALSSQIEAFDAHTHGLQSELSHLREALAASCQRVESLTTQIGRQAAQRDQTLAEVRDVLAVLVAAQGSWPTAEEIADQVQSLGTQHEEVLRLLREWNAAKQDAANRREEALELLEAQRFTSPTQMEEAWIEPEEMDQLKATVNLRDQAEIAVRSGLERAEVKAVAELAGPQAAARADESASAYQDAVKKHQDCQALALESHHLAERVKREAEVFRDAVRSLEDGRERSLALIRVAQLAEGNPQVNTKNLTLQSFVLLRRFEQVLDAANARLTDMSQGRYLLQRVDREEVSGRRYGLGLRVFDAATDSLRDPRTLSGGESFYVALCLALGLADMVTAEAGGVELGTLFIDEGFGALSDEPLERVLAELKRLRSGGRSVGVVSHVEALKSAIPDRVSVRAGTGGSSLTVIA